MKKQKKIEAISFDDLKKVVQEDAKKNDGKLTQEKIDMYLSTYDLDDMLAEELLTFIGEQHIDISDDSLDDLEVDDASLLSDTSTVDAL